MYVESKVTAEPRTIMLPDPDDCKFVTVRKKRKSTLEPDVQKKRKKTANDPK